MLHIYQFIYSPQDPKDIGTIIIPILQMWKSKPKEVKYLPKVTLLATGKAERQI